MKLRVSHKILLALWGLMLALNLLARFCHPAVDWYIAYVFPYISAFWCRISGAVPFSVGEWMIEAAIVLVFAGIIAFPLVLVFGKDKRSRIAAILVQVYGWIVTWVFCIMTTRFLVLYQGTQLSRTLGATTYSNAEVLEVYRSLMEQANAEAALVARDEDGYFVMTDDLMPEAKACMARLSENYPQFAGYYPDAKPIYHAYFFSQQNLLGIYYPQSMEANYNPVVYEVNLPITVCHEYTHLKGNIFEDEAGYYAYLACMTSDSHDFRYSAYVSALEWMHLEFGEDDAAWEEYFAISSTISDELDRDLYAFVPESYWDAHKDTDEVIPTAIVSETADKVMDASLKVNGVPEGVQSYSGMTALLLHYYLDAQ